MVPAAEDPAAVTVRWAEPSEVEALEELQRRSSMVWEEYRDDLLAHPEAIEVPEAQVREHGVRVATCAGRLAGFAAVVPGRDGVGELDGLFVEPDLMGRGIGRRLIDDAVRIGVGGGLTRLEVTANPRALGFYERLGFVADREVPTRFGPGVRMHRELSA
jgi:GNAT superfamily N-acetyltransferase